MPGMPPLWHRNCSLRANAGRKVAGVYRNIKSRIRADDGDQILGEPPLPPLPRSQVLLPSDRFLANATLEKELVELQEMRERDRRRAGKIEKELEDHKLQLRRQCAETDALKQQILSQNPLINFDSVVLIPTIFSR